MFPVRGHSFLPADRVFGRIEQDIRKQATILLPEEYISILSHQGSVHRYLQDWQSFDFKGAAKKSIKATKPFKVSTVKVLEIRGSCVGVKDTYSADLTTYSILKKGQNWDIFSPSLLPPKSHVKPAKRIDTLKLLMELQPPQDIVEFCNATLGDGPGPICDNSSDVDSD